MLRGFIYLIDFILRFTYYNGIFNGQITIRNLFNILRRGLNLFRHIPCKYKSGYAKQSGKSNTEHGNNPRHLIHIIIYYFLWFTCKKHSILCWYVISIIRNSLYIYIGIKVLFSTINYCFNYYVTGLGSFYTLYGTQYSGISFKHGNIYILFLKSIYIIMKTF